MDDKRFWTIIESAWQAIGGWTRARRELAAGDLSEDDADELAEALEDFTAALREQLDGLSAGELLAFNQLLERKLYDIDRADVHEYTDGTDDGFLYARGFIVAAGQGYYEAVDANPAIAMMDLECEEMCYLPGRCTGRDSEKYRRRRSRGSRTPTRPAGRTSIEGREPCRPSPSS